MSRGLGFWLRVGLIALLCHGIRDYVIDDPFIHLPFARHVRDGARPPPARSRTLPSAARRSSRSA